MALKITRLDQNKVLEGVPAEYLGVTLRIARQNNIKYLTALKTETEKRGRKPLNKLPVDVRNQIILRAMAEFVLVGWEEDEFIVDGKPVPYTVENSLELLTNDAECLNFVSGFAMDTKNYIEEMEAVTGEG